MYDYQTNPELRSIHSIQVSDIYTQEEDSRLVTRLTCLFETVGCQ